MEIVSIQNNHWCVYMCTSSVNKYLYIHLPNIWDLRGNPQRESLALYIFMTHNLKLFCAQPRLYFREQLNVTANWAEQTNFTGGSTLYRASRFILGESAGPKTRIQPCSHQIKTFTVCYRPRTEVMLSQVPVILSGGEGGGRWPTLGQPPRDHEPPHLNTPPPPPPPGNEPPDPTPARPRASLEWSGTVVGMSCRCEVFLSAS